MPLLPFTLPSGRSLVAAMTLAFVSAWILPAPRPAEPASAMATPPPPLAQEAAPAPTASASTGAQETPAHQRWVDENTPGEPHAFLDRLAGTWTTAFFRGAYEEGKQPSSTASQANTWVLDGRFLRMEYKSHTRGGQPYVAVSLVGHSNARGEFQVVGMDNVDTSMAFSTGQLIEGDTQLVLRGTAPDPERAGAIIETLEVFEILDADRHVATRYDLDADGEEHLRFAVLYTRAE